MARSRNIKPGFFVNEDLGELDPLARILFAGLWCHADREGRLEDRLRRLKPQILPFDNCDIEVLAQCLHDAKLILRYVIDNKRYIQILQFKKHQNPHIKEAPSTIPAPCEHSSSIGVATLIPDSLNPLTDSLDLDSLNPSNPLSGDEKKRLNGKAQYVADAENVMQYLNRNARKGFEFRNRNGDLTASAEKIIARLKQGYTALELREVVFDKCGKWAHDDKMAEYLRPTTLFGKEKFEQYIGELKGT